MREYVFAFVASIALGASIGGLSACSFGSDCDCRPAAPLPEAQAPLPIAQASSYDARGNEIELPIDLTTGTVEVTGDAIVVRYTEGDVEHVATYAVIPSN